MASIGIVINPASGRDARRIVSCATLMDNNEKVNIVKRVILASQELGVDKVYFMPDAYYKLGRLAISDLEHAHMLKAEATVLDVFPLFGDPRDTVASVKKMVEVGVQLIVVLGGDGTSRLVSKYLNGTPILPISTGTNNVYPGLVEGTVGGMAAAVTCMLENPYDACIQDKQIEIYVNGEFRDIALIDAAVVDIAHIGSKAIWDIQTIEDLVVTRCHPATIGFSAMAGCMKIVRDTEDMAYYVKFGKEGTRFRAPVAAGMLEDVFVKESGDLPLETPYVVNVKKPCVVEVDGEREVQLHTGDEVKFVVKRNGPWRIQVIKAVELGQQMGIFNTVK